MLVIASTVIIATRLSGCAYRSTKHPATRSVISMPGSRKSLAMIAHRCSASRASPGVDRSGGTTSGALSLHSVVHLTKRRTSWRELSRLLDT